MFTYKKLGIGTLALFVLLMLAACEPGAQPAAEEETTDEEAMTDQAAMTPPDTTGTAIWAHLQRADYQNWPLWPDQGELYAGQDPHGMLLTTYVNEAALGALNAQAGTMPDGAVIVKENYMPDSTLAAVTVMFKQSGYNPDHNDWFFTKHKPDGSLDVMPNGMAMEGRLPGCQACHGTKADNDYIFTSPLAAAQE